ncbi:uncharacterized protein ACWYII_000997 [Salvelinus alpinus]
MSWLPGGLTHFHSSPTLLGEKPHVAPQVSIHSRITHHQRTKQHGNGQQQRSQDSWTWEEILDSKGPWAQAGEYRRPKAELEAAKAERRWYEEAARKRGWKPERQPQKCIGGRHTGSVAGSVGLGRLGARDLYGPVSTVRSIRCLLPAPALLWQPHASALLWQSQFLLPALAQRCVSPARYHQFRHHAPGLQCASKVQYALFLLPALAQRCVSPARYHQFRHHAPIRGPTYLTPRQRRTKTTVTRTSSLCMTQVIFPTIVYRQITSLIIHCITNPVGQKFTYTKLTVPLNSLENSRK